MKNHAVPEKTYVPDTSTGWGLHVWREMIAEALAAKELFWRMVVRDVSARYRQSVLGILWAFVGPLVSVAVFVFLNTSGVIQGGDTGMPYPVFVLLGTTIWYVFATGITACTQSLTNAGSMILKINFPKETLVVSAMGQVLMELAIRVGLCVVGLAIFQVSPKWTAIFLPLSLIPLILFTLGLGFFFSVLNAVFRDMGQAVGFATTFLMLVTPVVYAAPSGTIFERLSALNPLAALINTPRELLILGAVSDVTGFVISSVLGVTLFVLGWRVFHLLEPRIAERV